VEPAAKTSPCKPFSVCVGNYTLSFDGACFQLAARKWLVPDGTYSAIQFQDGCVVGVGQVPVPSYTPPACCSQDSGGGTPTINVPVSPDSCNLTAMGPAGLQTFLNVAPGSGVSVTGCGTTGNPLRISASASGGGSITAQSGDSPIRVQGDGSTASPLIVGMNKSVDPSNYGGLQVNKYGLVTGYQATSGGATVHSLVGMNGVVADEQPIGSGVYAVGLAPTGVVAAKYRLGRYDVSVNAQGQITGVAEAFPPLTAGSFYTPADPSIAGDRPKRVSYNTDGVITGVQPV
jgi:hypothetical protein